MGILDGFRARPVRDHEEHTLGARIRDGRLLELNGSVLPALLRDAQ